jgi:hypothetical protein
MHRSVLRLLAALVLTLAALPLTAFSASAASYVVKGTINGYNASNVLVPAAGINVDLYRNGAYLTQVKASSTGAYSFAAPGAGSYTVLAWCTSGTVCDQTWLSEYFGGSHTQSGAKSFSVVAGTPYVANIRLDRWGVVEGTVTDEAGNVPSVPVRVSVSGSLSSANAVTDASGKFRVTRVSPGSNRVSAEDAAGDEVFQVEYALADGTSSPDAYDSQLTVASAPAVTKAGFALDRIVGAVVVAKDVNGVPLRGIGFTPYAKDPDGSWSPGGRGWNGDTDAQGRGFVRADLGDTLYLCLHDDLYDVDYGGKQVRTIRYNDACVGGSTLATATPVTLTEANRHPKFTVTLSVAGQSLQPQGPFVLGTHAVGETLSVDTGTWAPADTAVALQWYDGAWENAQAIAGATANTFTIPAELQDHAIFVAATGTKAGYRTATIRSEPYRVGAITPTASPQTSIVGNAVQGQTLRAQDGTFSPTGDGSWVTHRWYVGGKVILEGDSLTLTAAHVGQKVSLRTEYQPPYSSSGNDLHMLTTTAGVVQGLLTAPTPTISGTKAVGYSLAVAPGTWAPAPVTLSYQWLRSGVAIAGATGSTYKLTSYDKGKAISVRATGTKTNYVTAVKNSAATSAILGAYSSAPTPTISGTKKVGYTLTANHGTWSPAPSSYKYQWYRGTTAISGAVSKTYKLTSYDKGKVVKVKVTPVLSGYYSPGKYSSGSTIY